MKILIVDDEALARKRMSRLIEDIGDHTVVGEAANGKEALMMSGEMAPDIVLLDIRMPEIDGLETALHLSKLPNPPAVIFTTAFSDHALAAFESHAVDYLLKPIRGDRLKAAIDKACTLNRAQLVELHDGENRQTGRSHLSVNVRGRVQLIAIKDIFYFQADQKYIKVRHSQGEVLIEDSLKALEEEFSSKFLRIHRNALVSLAYIEGIGKSTEGCHRITFRDIDDQLEISRRHLPAVRKMLKAGALA